VRRRWPDEQGGTGLHPVLGLGGQAFVISLIDGRRASGDLLSLASATRASDSPDPIDRSVLLHPEADGPAFPIGWRHDLTNRLEHQLSGRRWSQSVITFAFSASLARIIREGPVNNPGLTWPAAIPACSGRIRGGGRTGYPSRLPREGCSVTVHRRCAIRSGPPTTRVSLKQPPILARESAPIRRRLPPMRTGARDSAKGGVSV